jgi:hypothetical protein
MHDGQLGRRPGAMRRFDPLLVTLSATPEPRWSDRKLLQSAPDLVFDSLAVLTDADIRRNIETFINVHRTSNLECGHHQAAVEYSIQQYFRDNSSNLPDNVVDSLSNSACDRHTTCRNL